MTVNFSGLFPAIEPVLKGLAQIPIIKYVNETVWIFALVETAHLLFLTVLGGSVIALNLRVLGLVLPGVPVQDVERAVRSWYRAGVTGAIVTGIAMGVTTARTLLPSGAFFIKMIALVAAILLSNIVTREAREGREAATQAGLLRLGAALLLWVSTLLLFALTAGLSSGGILIALAGAALLSVATQRRHRPLVIGLSALALAGWFGWFNGVIGPGQGPDLAWLSPSVLAVVAVAPALRVGTRQARDRSSQKDVATKLTAYASLLAWVTVAAAGRWIGFS